MSITRRFFLKSTALVAAIPSIVQAAIKPENTAIPQINFVDYEIINYDTLRKQAKALQPSFIYESVPNTDRMETLAQITVKLARQKQLEALKQGKYLCLIVPCWYMQVDARGQTFYNVPHGVKFLMAKIIYMKDTRRGRVVKDQFGDLEGQIVRI